MERVREYEPSCAICGGPTDGECTSGCEGNRLNVAIDQAEEQWLTKWRAKSREWVANNAIRYVTATFQSMKEARLATHAAHLKSIPYWEFFEQYHRPPMHPHLMHPHLVADIRRQVRDAEIELRRNIDADWKSCVIRYPEVLAHFYSLVSVNMPLPKDVTAPTGIMPGVSNFLTHSRSASVAPGSMAAGRSTVGGAAAAAAKKQRRRSTSGTPKPTDSSGGLPSLDALTKLLYEQQMAKLGGLGGLGGAGAGGLTSGLAALAASNGMHKAGRTSPAFDASAHTGPAASRKKAGKAPAKNSGASLPRVPVPPVGRGWEQLHSHSHSTRFE